ncbi:MAG: lamin tail domain-containing protein [Clostridia bacterium]|nr:lamin tail domain-containing protein [Clostridia bacterium]
MIRTRANLSRVIWLIILVAALIAAVVFYLTHRGGTETSVQPRVVLNEIMASNKGAVADEYGDFPDWVELCNTSDAAVDISGYGLSDDFLSGAKYVVPQGTVIEPGGFFVVYCSGEETDNWHASFKISATEELILYETTGTVIESMQLRAALAGHTLARTDAGAWEDMAPSPGYPNTPDGIAAYQASVETGEDIGLYINEFMASNKSVLSDMHGLFSDWVELYNATSAPIDLSGFGLSDSEAQPLKYALPDGTSIPANGYLVLFCSGNQTTLEEGELHVPFSLSAYEEDVVLSDPKGRIIDSVRYERQEADVSCARMPDGTGDFTLTARPTPGYPNTDAGYTQFVEANVKPLNALHFSEMMGSNRTSLSLDKTYPDWAELYNSGAEAINLSGYAVSNSVTNPAKWVFPNISIEPGERLLLYATGDGVSANSISFDANAVQKKNLRLNFFISSTGETLYLFDPEGRLLDKLSAGSFLPDVSCGRAPDGQIRYYKLGTPGQENGADGYAGVTAAPQFSIKPGVYDAAQAVALSANDGETIHYTLDCTTPTDASPVYESPIPVEKNTVIRAMATKSDCLTGGTSTGTFLLKSDNADHALPIACLVTDPANLWDGQNGIYAFGDNYDENTTNYTDMLVSSNFYKGKTSEQDQAAWTRGGNFSICDDAGTAVFSQDIDMRIAGAYGRGRAQKGFNIIARDTYGADRMAYAFFANRPYTEYKSLTLRAGAQDQNYSKIRDELATGLLEGTDAHILVQAYKPYVLYLNGEYWGVYFLKEKRSRFFVAQHEGVEDAMNLDLVKSSTRVSHGTADEWNDLMEYVKAHDLSQKAAYEHVAGQVDVESFADYMIAEIWSANTDTWNVQYYKLPNGKWRFIYYDFCWSMRDASHKTLAYRRESSKPLSDLFNALLKNSEWRDAFIRRFAYMLQNVYNAERVNARIDELYAIVEPEIKREREKFNQETFMGVKQLAECLGDYDRFQSEIKRLHDFATGREASLRAQFQSEFSLSDAYMQEVFGA